jgi:hypothetical protein
MIFDNVVPEPKMASTRLKPNPTSSQLRPPITKSTNETLRRAFIFILRTVNHMG